MTSIAVAPLFLKDYTLKVAADNYEKAVSGVLFTPSTTTSEWHGPIGSDFTDVMVTGWTVQIDYAQDWRTPGSFSRYLHAHQGETVNMEFVPSSDPDEPSFTADIVVVPGPIGGTTRSPATASVTCGVQGTPELVEPV